MAQWVKDLLWLRSPLYCGFDPWPRNFHMLNAARKKGRRELLSPTAHVKAQQKADSHQTLNLLALSPWVPSLQNYEINNSVVVYSLL